MRILHLLLIISVTLILSSLSTTKEKTINTDTNNNIRVGAERLEIYLPFIKNKRVAIVANHSSLVKNTNLIDTLLSLNINIKKIFCPEHGFRGTADAGEIVNNYIDEKTKLPIISLYGKNYKPKPNDLKNIDIVIFDIQDVGVRFYTYISTMHYMMEACAENNVEFMILDRPNPNGHYVDGPVLQKEYKSFIGMHPVACVHGLTVAEYARMINDEGWLKNGIKCKLRYVLIQNYNHETLYNLPVKPSPNLPNMQAIYLYPSLGLFEGTVISIGRGTDIPFQVYGHPKLTGYNFYFIPRSRIGAKYPLYENIKCYGVDMRNIPTEKIKYMRKINIEWLMDAYNKYPDKKHFFNELFDKLAGNGILRQQIINNVSEKEIRDSWSNELNKYKSIRKKYLLYPDFSD